jgi:phage terminase small subunit
MFRWTLAGLQALFAGGEAVATERRKLTPKQAAFVREYLIDLNATQAAKRAGYSEATANEQGARLLANVSVREAIEAAQAERASRVEVTADNVLRILLAEATADDGPTCKLARVKAAELLGKHLAMFADRSKVEVSGDVSVLLAASVERYKELARRQREDRARE